MSTELLDVAVRAARAAAAELLARADGAAAGVVAKSTPTDLVSEADIAGEHAIRALLAVERPDDAIMGEEGEDTPGTTGLRWIVDPLDGTINYLFGLPQWCVSVACEGQVGVILDPVRDELFTVVAGRPAAHDGIELAGSRATDLSTALVATGFGYDTAVRERQAAAVARVLPRVRDIRRMGSAALDLAWTAAGRYDAYYERGVKPWDIAAGVMLCEAAGLVVRTLPADDVQDAGIVAAAPGLVDELVALVG